MHVPDITYFGTSLIRFQKFIKRGGFYAVSWQPVFTDSMEVAEQYARSYRDSDVDKYYFWANCETRDRVNYGVVLKVRIKNPGQFDEPKQIGSHWCFRLKEGRHIPPEDIIEVRKIGEPKLEKPIGALP